MTTAEDRYVIATIKADLREAAEQKDNIPSGYGAGMSAIYNREKDAINSATKGTGDQRANEANQAAIAEYFRAEKDLQKLQQRARVAETDPEKARQMMTSDQMEEAKSKAAAAGII